MSKDKVSDAEEARELLDASIREARGLLKDCRDTMREMRELIPEMVGERVADETTRQLGQIGKATQRAIELAEQSVFERFDNLANMLMGTTGTRRGKREPSVEEMAHAVSTMERLKAKKKKGTFDG